MMRYISLRQRQKHFLSFTGLKVEEFARLVANIHFDWIHQRIERLTKDNPKRKRKLGGGRKKILSSLEDQLLLTLFWAKHYPSYLLLEYLFGIDESTVCRTIQDVKLLLQDKFVFPEPRKGKKITTLEELKEVIPDLDDILADTTEQPIPRPKKKRKRNKHHSGKKKRFTVKTQIATNKQGLIIHLGRASPGRKHDYKLFKESSLPEIIAKQSKLYEHKQNFFQKFRTLNLIRSFKN